MKNITVIFFSVLLGLLASYSALAQPADTAAPFSSPKTKVLISPITCGSEDQYLAIAAKTVSSTLELVLRMSGRYEVETDESMIPENLFMLCEKRGVPNIIYGSSSYSENGEIVFELSVYNMEKNSVTITKKEKAESVLDVFSTADTLALSLAESFSGMRMAFGKVKLISIGDKGDIIVRIGESVTVPDSPVMEKVLAGKRDIEIIQERMFGRYTVMTYQIEIVENGITDIVYFIPGFTKEEDRLIKEKEAMIEKSLSTVFKKAGTEKAIEIYNELIEKDLALVSYSESAAEKKRELIEKRDALVSGKR